METGLETGLKALRSDPQGLFAAREALMTDDAKPGQNPKIAKSDAIPLRSFFERHPPGSPALVHAMPQPSRNLHGHLRVALPDVMLHCSSESCSGPRLHSSKDDWQVRPGTDDLDFISYICRNCGKGKKTYAVQGVFDEVLAEPATLQKFGEIPGFGPPTPSRVITLLGSERDYYLKGRRAENQSLGIAAFAYYRRVVENKKAAIFDEIIRVSQRLGADPELLKELGRAKGEPQFTKAVEAVKHAIPQALMINGHNPLTLLHSALSEGLHAQSDQECLEVAASIRIVLTEFVERASAAMKEEKELTEAVARLLQVKRDRAQPAAVPSGVPGAAASQS